MFQHYALSSNALPCALLKMPPWALLPEQARCASPGCGSRLGAEFGWLDSLDSHSWDLCSVTICMLL